MNAWIETWNAAAVAWFDIITRASWQGGIALAVVWLISRFISRIPPACKVWLWRLAFLKLLVALVWLTPIALPVLPREGHDISPVEPAVLVAPIIHETTLEDASAFQAVARSPSLDWRVWLLVAWCAGLLWCAARLASHWREARRLIAGAPLLRNAAAEEIVRSLKARFRLRAVPLVRESSFVSSPMLVGVLRPQIILPGVMPESASPSRLELMLAHELAHCRRKDLLWLWLFTVAEALFFFHPLVWFARREWALATEAACDELALRVTRDAPREYGEMLIDLIAAARQPANPTGLIAVGMIENANTLKRRLKVMITTRTRLGTLGGIALIAVAAVTLAPWKLTAQDADTEAAAKLKEENAKLRQELDAMRRDVEKMRADGELRKRADAKREAEDRLKNELARAQARNMELQQQQKERFRADQQRVMEEVQAELHELRTQFTEDHPKVREKKARLETLEAIDTALGGATRDRKRRALLQQEIELVERQVEIVRKGVEDRTQSSAALVAAQRELLEVKVQMAKLSASKDVARAELRQQLELAEGMLKEHKKLAEARLASPGEELPLQREVLRIKRQLHELEASDSGERPNF